MRRMLAAETGLLLCAAALGAQAAPPKPSLSSPEQNVAFAVQAICLPYVMDAVDVSTLPLKQPFVADDGYKPGASHGALATVRVGFAGFVHVSVNEQAGRRSCELTARGGDPQSLRQAMLQVLAQRPERFGPTRSRYLPGRWGTERPLHCRRQRQAGRRRPAFGRQARRRLAHLHRLQLLHRKAGPLLRSGGCEAELSHPDAACWRMMCS